MVIANGNEPTAVLTDQKDDASRAASVISRPISTGSPSQPMGSVADVLLLRIAQAADDIEPFGTLRGKLRDRQLRAFYPGESHFNSALGMMCARNAAFSYQLEGGPRMVRKIQQVLDDANEGEGWHDLILKVSQDLYTSDNGAIIEIVRDGDSEFASLIGLNHLDSAHCYHTGDPKAPVIYRDREGKFHQLKWYQVVTLAELPTPIEMLYGRQMCALSRCLKVTQIIRDVMVYQQEKVGGRFEKAIHVVKGITTQQIQDALNTSRIEMDRKGQVRFTNVPIVGIPEPEGTLQIATLMLASLPDNYDQEKWLQWYITVLAMAFLSDFQDFAPLPSGNIGTGQQSVTLDKKGAMKGAALFRKIMGHALNHKVLPKTVEFKYEVQNVDMDQAQALVAKTRVEGYQILRLAADLPAAAIRQMAVDDGVISQDIFDQLGEMDITDTVRVEDDDNPDVPPPPESQPPDDAVAAPDAPPDAPTGRKRRRLFSI